MLSQEEKDLILTGLFKKEPNRFAIATAVSKRARQIKEGSPLLLEHEEDKLILPVISALEELGNNKLNIVMNEDISDDALLIDEINQYLDVDQSATEADVAVEKAPAKKKKTKSAKSESAVS